MPIYICVHICYFIMNGPNLNSSQHFLMLLEVSVVGRSRSGQGLRSGTLQLEKFHSLFSRLPCYSYS